MAVRRNVGNGSKADIGNGNAGPQVAPDTSEPHDGRRPDDGGEAMPSGLKLRVLGLAMIVGAGAFGYSSAEALGASIERIEQIYESVKLFVLTPLLLVLGLVLLFGGGKLEGGGGNQRSILALAFLAALALGASAWWLFGERLGAPGLIV